MQSHKMNNPQSNDYSDKKNSPDIYLRSASQNDLVHSSLATASARADWFISVSKLNGSVTVFHLKFKNKHILNKATYCS